MDYQPPNWIGYQDKDCWYLFTDPVHKAVREQCERQGESFTISSKELLKALAEEGKPIATRLSKSLYRYAVELDMLTQIVAYAEIPFDALDDIRREAKLRVAQQRGRIDVSALLQEERTKQLLEDMEDWE